MPSGRADPESSCEPGTLVRGCSAAPARSSRSVFSTRRGAAGFAVGGPTRDGAASRTLGPEPAGRKPDSVRVTGSAAAPTASRARGAEPGDDSTGQDIGACRPASAELPIAPCGGDEAPAPAGCADTLRCSALPAGPAGSADPAGSTGSADPAGSAGSADPAGSADSGCSAGAVGSGGAVDTAAGESAGSGARAAPRSPGRLRAARITPGSNRPTSSSGKPVPWREPDHGVRLLDIVPG